MEATPFYLFEDPGWRRFAPLTSLRPVWDLRVGLHTLGERIAQQLDREPSGWYVREALQPLLKDKHGKHSYSIETNDDVVIINGRAIGKLPTEILSPKQTWSVWSDGPEVVMAKLPASIARKWLARPSLDPAEYSTRTLLEIWGTEFTAPEIQLNEMDNTLAFWPWDLLHFQEEAIKQDFARFHISQINGEVNPKAILVEDSNIYISSGAKIAAGAILDATDGPILIEDGVQVMPGAIIIGPVAIGRDSKIKPGAKLHGPLTIGPVCKMGGEVEDSIIQGYSNKQHEGFLGHAILGEWVNLGADTNNSDLKNNYSNVKVVIEGETIDTGSTFFGSIIGDHVKTAINTQLNTGTVIGIGSNIFGAGFPPKTIPHFQWGGKDGFDSYDFDKFLVTAKASMARRDKIPSSAMVALMRQLHHDTIINE